MKTDKIYTWATKKIGNGLFLAKIVEIQPLDEPKMKNGYEIWANTEVIHEQQIKGNRAKASRYAQKYTRYLRSL